MVRDHDRNIKRARTIVARLGGEIFVFYFLLNTKLTFKAIEQLIEIGIHA